MPQIAAKCPRGCRGTRVLKRSGTGSAANGGKVTSSRGAPVPGPPAGSSGGPEVRGARVASILSEISPFWVYRMASRWPISRLWAPSSLPGGSGVALGGREVKIGDLEAILLKDTGEFFKSVGSLFGPWVASCSPHP